MSIIGIDCGTSATKVIEYEGNKIEKRLITDNKPYKEALDEFINKYNINLRSVSQIIITGIGADIDNGKTYNIPVIKVDEFIAIATGGLKLANKKQGLIISVGTGTAFVKAEKNNIIHIGGTGVGAGTLTNLCAKFAGVNSFEEIKILIKDGNLSNVDLKIGDISKEEIKTLPKDITLSNFGKIDKNVNNSDIALGILNMIFETIGMMAVFAIKNEKIREVIITGTIASLPQIKYILQKIEKLHNIKFIIPKDAEYATALGAIAYTIY